MGSDVLIDVGVLINGAQNIECGNKVWIDSYAILNCPIEKLQLEIMFISIPILILEEKKK